ATLDKSGLFAGLAGPLEPNGTVIAPAGYMRLHTALGDPRKLPLTEPAAAAAAGKIPARAYDAPAPSTSLLTA
ncbi:MAG TPA: hypothetical protein VFE59_35925, partial [Trebonia sp.]|nr:hypothetical protein [Trebonia sp.]